MNFFEQQDRARRNTQRLILLMGLAVLSLITITALMFAGVFAYLHGGSTTHLAADGQSFGFWRSILNALSWELIAWISLMVCSVVFMGSFYKLMRLRGGGKAVAEAMGGQLINTHTSNAEEKRILNVVEEIAIASGTPVPPVYLIEDEAINAFAAGHNPQDAVIGITRGCIHLLSRDELQGVIAHEFSHIFYGDMRINIRLVAILHGILVLGLIGHFLVRSTHHRSVMRTNRGKSPAAVLSIGVGLIVIGYTGTFFGNLIKAAVSRQREFLADASAVQFTRNPDGISGALKKIGGHVNGSMLQASNAAEFSHLYFSQGVSTAFTMLMATHPPLGERIKRIEPRWDGSFPSVEISLANALEKEQLGATDETVSHFSDSAATGSTETTALSPNDGASLERAITQIGNPSAAHLADAREKIQAIGDDLRECAHDSFSARALIFGLLLDANPNIRAKQWQELANTLSHGELANLKTIAERAAKLDAKLRLPLVELALPALKELNEGQLMTFKRCTEILIRADKKISLFEWALQRIVFNHLELQPRHHRLSDLRNWRDECQLLISVLAYAGAKSEQDAQKAFALAAETLRLSTLTILSKSACKIPRLDAALANLNSIKPLQKPQLLKAMGKCIACDGKITAIEAELFRAIADGLDCPVPPLLISKEP